MNYEQIGWVIVPRALRSYHNNVRVYATENTAKRYARGAEVKPVYLRMD